MSEEAFIYEAIRTPRGKQTNGSLNEVKPLNLVVGLIDELRKRNPDLDESLISDMILGVVSPVGDQGGDIARAAVLASGLPVTSGGVQLNRFCALRSGGRQHRRAEGALRLGRPGAGRRCRVDEPRADGLRRRRLGDSIPRPTTRSCFVPQGIGADLIATIEGFSREDVDDLRAAQPGRKPPRPGRVATSPSQWCRCVIRTVWSSSTTTSTCDPTPRWRAWPS